MAPGPYWFIPRFPRFSDGRCTKIAGISSVRPGCLSWCIKGKTKSDTWMLLRPRSRGLIKGSVGKFPNWRSRKLSGIIPGSLTLNTWKDWKRSSLGDGVRETGKNRREASPVVPGLGPRNPTRGPLLFSAADLLRFSSGRAWTPIRASGEIRRNSAKPPQMHFCDPLASAAVVASVRCHSRNGQCRIRPRPWKF